MSLTRSPIGTSSPVARSAVSNGSRLLTGIDGRSASARRFRDLARDFAGELGGEDALTAPQRALVRHAAAVVLESEALQAAIVRGEDVDHEQLVRVSNVLARLMRDLGVKGTGKQKEPGADLNAYLKSRNAA
ncbi:hypothetical protein [Fulvimarina sp. MAC3]|uniref:hypothetical protein n=1 Tax=Fulvimarina sp. MAC3 TaxID=3148887 RepID=UPI0031FC6F18